MYKLNNHGWGLQVLIASILVLMIGLVIVAILIQQTFGDIMGSIDDSGQSIVDEKPSQDSTLDSEEPKYTYEKLENMLLEATKEYQKKFYDDILDGEKISVTIKRLVSEGLLNEIKDIKDNSICTGYGLFNLDDGKITYKAFLNCSNYQTIGYNEIYDFS